MTKYAFISGASSGIGYALAEEFSRKGFKVIGCSPEREVSLMEPLKEKWGVIPVACDITNTKDIQRVKEIVLKETGGRLEYLYNNAGIALGGPAIESQDADIEKIFKVNVLGHIAMTREFSDYIIRGKGTIVFTSSVAGRVPLPMCSLYCATKAAIDHFAHTLAMEMKPFDVHVVSVITGGVNTGVGDHGFQKEYRESKFFVEGIKDMGEEISLMARRCPIPCQPHEYAASVVGYLTSHKNPSVNIYHGGLAWFLNFLGRYTPVWFHSFGIARKFKFDVVAKNVRKKHLAGGYNL